MGLMENTALGGLLGGFNQAFFPQMERNDRLLEAQKRREQEDRLKQAWQKLQEQQMQTAQAAQDRQAMQSNTDKAAMFEALNPLRAAEVQGGMGNRDMSRVSSLPSSATQMAIANYQSPEEKAFQALLLAKAKEKPNYDIFEKPDGGLQYLEKGLTIPSGWKKLAGTPTVQIGGSGQIIGDGGVPYSATEVRDMRKQLMSAQGMGGSLDRLEELVKKHGWEPAWGGNNDVVSTIDSAHRAVQMEFKELLNLGVLNGPDLELMDQMLPSPTDIPTNPARWINRQEALLKGINEVRGFLERKKKLYNEKLNIESPKQKNKNTSDFDKMPEYMQQEVDRLISEALNGQ